MKYLPELSYPESERPKLELLAELFRDWHDHFAKAGSALSKLADKMVFDGFYPFYFSQPKRVLFIGWEAREIAGYNYIHCSTQPIAA